MSTIFAGAFADAAALWRRDRDLLMRVSGVFFFLPSFGQALFLPPMPVPAEDSEVLRVFLDYGRANAHWLIAAACFQVYGSATLFALLFSGGRATLGEAMKRAAAAFPVYLFTAVLASLLVMAGASFFFVPGFYIVGRTFFATAVVMAEDRRNPIRALGRSVELTARRGWLFFLVTATIVLAALAATGIVDSIQRGIGGGMAGRLVLDAVTAAISAAMSLAMVLVKTAAYRRVIAASSGT